MIGLVFGPPGSGKGTQATLLAPELGIPHVSTGEVLRAEVAAATPVGSQVESLLKAGELVPDELIEGLVEERLRQPDAAGGLLLDGYPRTVAQAEVLDRLLERTGQLVDFVLHLDLDERNLERRLLERAAQQHRPDDNPTSIAERFGEYRHLTEPVLDHYRRRGVPVHDVIGEGDVETVQERVRAALGGVLS